MSPPREIPAHGEPTAAGLRRTACAVALLAAGVAAALPVSSASGAPEEPKTPVEKYFHGKIRSLKGTAIEISYDFEDASQLQDFEKSIPFRAIKTIQFAQKSGKVALEGTGSMRLRAVFGDEVAAEATFVPRRPRDFGFAVSEERESEVFTLYCCYDRYFGLGDNVTVPQNMIIKFLARDPKANANGLQDWRYCGSRGQKPEIAAGRSYKVGISRSGMESRLAIDDWESKGKETGRDLTAQMVAVYLYDSQVDMDDLVVRGKLDPGWAARAGIDLTTWKPPAEPAPEEATGPVVTDAVAARIRAQIDGYPLDTRPQDLAALLRDATLPAELRAEAAEKAKTNGAKRIVPYLVDGLYSEDLDARKLTFDVLKTLTGKSFGYRPDGSEDARKKGIREVNDYIKKHAAEFV